MLSAMNNEFMNNRLVEMLLLHNVGGIFPNVDALDTEHGFRKRATGVFAAIWNKPIRNMTSSTKIQTSSTLTDSVEYANSNGVINKVYFPKLFGWKFENTTDEAIILTNLSADTVVVSVSNLFTSSNISWEKWSSDSLLAHIDSISYINKQSAVGGTNIVLSPYSINVALGNTVPLDIDFPTYKDKKKLLKIVDVLGREILPRSNIPLFYIYDGGVVEKKIIIE